MKKILSILLALALMLGAAALAEGNVTIAVQGMNDFSDYIQSMIVYGDKLLLSSWDTLYTWDNTGRKLTPVDGYDKLQNVLTGDGETPGALELNDGEYAYLDGNLYAVGGKLYRMATISDEDGNSTNQLVELLIADDGALSLGEIIDLGDALCIVETYGDESYTYTRNLSNPCSVGSMLYALSYGEELELLALNLEDESVEALTVDVDGDVQNIAPYTEGKLLMTVGDYTTETPSTTRAARCILCSPAASGAWTSARTASASRRNSATCRCRMPAATAWFTASCTCSPATMRWSAAT